MSSSSSSESELELELELESREMEFCPFCLSDGFQPASKHTPCDSKNAETRCSSCTSLIELDEKIEEVRQHLIDLSAARQRLLTDINQGHDTLTSRLPLEIVSNIFVYCNADADEWVPFPGPIPLTQVCRSWQTISYSTPRLWTTLRIEINDGKETRQSEWHALATQWIRRCGNSLPVSLSLSIDRDANHRSRYCTLVYHIINMFSHRFNHLEIDAPAKFIQRLCSLYQCEVTLPTLEIRCTSKLKNSFRGLINFAARSLYMENVTLRGVGIDARNLTHVEASNIPIKECANLFVRATQLVSCVFSHIPWESGHALNSPSPIIHRALKTLKIEERSGKSESIIFIMVMVNLPSLEQLSVEIPTQQQRGEVVTALIDHLRRSDLHLERLSISQLWDFEPVGLNSLMRTVGGSLRHLDLATENELKFIAILNTSLNDWACLESVTLLSCNESWIHILKEIVSFGSSMVSTRRRKFLVTLWSYYSQSPLDPKTANIVLNCNYTLSRIIPSVEIKAIISQMKNPLLVVRIEITKEGGDECIDITSDVVDALTRLTEKN